MYSLDPIKIIIYHLQMNLLLFFICYLLYATSLLKQLLYATSVVWFWFWFGMVFQWVWIDFELGFPMGLYCFWVGFLNEFWLILSWVFWWVWLDFGLAWFWVGFSGQLILGQLCGGLSNVQMICVGVGWVVVVVLLDWWLSSASSFFFLCFVGLLWTLEWSSLIEER